MPEPWLRNTHTDLPPIHRAAIHALELTAENLNHWVSQLNDFEMHATPSGLPSVSFQIRHIIGSLDRLLTYAEGNSLTSTQLHELHTEARSTGTRDEILAQLNTTIEYSKVRLIALPEDFAAQRFVGRDRLPVTLGGLIVHIADHTQRHTGQAITTVKILLTTLGFWWES